MGRAVPKEIASTAAGPPGQRKQEKLGEDTKQRLSSHGHPSACSGRFSAHDYPLPYARFSQRVLFPCKLRKPGYSSLVQVNRLEQGAKGIPFDLTANKTTTT